MTPFRVLTWHIHGSYLDSLAWTGHTFFIPVDDAERPGSSGRPGYAGRWPEWGPNVVEVPIENVRDLDVDLVLFQSRDAWERDQHEILTANQRRLPRIYLEHDPPRGHPTDQRHWVDDPEVLLVNVTHFNDLMWDPGRSPTRVIEHGVPDPGVRWTGAIERGIVVINDLATRGRRLGADLFLAARDEIPLDLVGMHAERLRGLGEIRRVDLPAFAARYRFFFNPIRYTSLGLGLIEAMTIGMPIVAFATTEIPVVLEDGESAILANDLGTLVTGMRALLDDRGLAERLGAAARQVAIERFSIERFAAGWTAAFAEVTGRGRNARPSAPVARRSPTARAEALP
jgi:Glycosyl transferases group 1